MVRRGDQGCLPSVRALRRIRWPRPRSRDRRTAHAMRRPLGSALTPPWVCAGRTPLARCPVRRAAFLSPGARVDVSADDHLELDPRSLARSLFLEGALASVFEVRRRLPTSATYFAVRAMNSELSFPRRDGGRNPLPFLTYLADSLAGRRHAASRKISTYSLSTPGQVPLLSEFAQPRCLRFVDTRRVGRPSEGRALRSTCVMRHAAKYSRLKSVSQHRSPPWRFPDTRCHRREGKQGRRPRAHARPIEVRVRVRPREGSHRLEDRGAFHRGKLEKVTDHPPGLLLRSRRPHVFHRLGKKCFGWALQGPPENESRGTFGGAAPLMSARCALA